MGTNKDKFNKTIAEKKRKSLVRRPRGRPPKQIVIEKEIFAMDYIKKVDKLSLEATLLKTIEYLSKITTYLQLVSNYPKNQMR